MLRTLYLLNFFPLTSLYVALRRMNIVRRQKTMLISQILYFEYMIPFSSQSHKIRNNTIINSLTLFEIELQAEYTS